ncbi:WD40-repeat-containing domain protein [Boletus coccyginus]|nr:WD40-repeat-containing domain protein [Boletus coccyginus]
MAACVATVSEDGKWIVCGCRDGKLRIVDAESQKFTIETNDRHSRKVTALDVSTDSSTAASGSSNGSVILWSITTGERVAGPLDLNKGKVSFVRFTHCGHRLAGCINTVNPPDQHGAVYILDIHDSQLTQCTVVVTFNSCVTAISWSADVNGRQRILAGLEESLAVIDPLHGESDSRKPIPGFRALSRNGKFIVSGTWQDHGVRFWDAATFAEIGPNLPSCLPLAISPNNTLVSLSRDARRCSLSIWNLSDILSERYTISVRTCLVFW